jgi:hypothetical protein
MVTGSLNYARGRVLIVPGGLQRRKPRTAI